MNPYVNLWGYECGFQQLPIQSLLIWCRWEKNSETKQDDDNKITVVTKTKSGSWVKLTHKSGNENAISGRALLQHA